MISVVGVTHASDGQSTDTAKKSKFSKVGVTKGPYPVHRGGWEADDFCHVGTSRLMHRPGVNKKHR